MNANTNVTCEPPVSESLALGLRALYSGFEDLERGVLAWVEANRKPGEEE